MSGHNNHFHNSTLCIQRMRNSVRTWYNSVVMVTEVLCSPKDGRSSFDDKAAENRVSYDSYRIINTTLGVFGCYCRTHSSPRRSMNRETPQYEGLSGPSYSITGIKDKFKLPPSGVLKVQSLLLFVSSHTVSFGINHSPVSMALCMCKVGPETTSNYAQIFWVTPIIKPQA